MTRFVVADVVALLLLIGVACSPTPEIEPAAPTPEVGFAAEADLIHVTLQGKPFTTYHFGEKWPKPFLHPVLSPRGTDVTRGWPVAPREGESDDHVWHRGLFMGHDGINGVDFWREKAPEETARLKPRAAPLTDEAAGTLRVELDLETPEGESLGALRQQFTFSGSGENAIVDVAIVADRGVALTLSDTEEAFVGMRFDDAFKQENGAWLTNADGLVGTENIWGKQAAWVDYSTTLAGEKIGVAMFDHPANPRHPSRWHARGYGFCTANAFGIRNFTGDESEDGKMEVAAGDELRFRYRFVIHPGDADEAGVKELYGVYQQGE